MVLGSKKNRVIRAIRAKKSQDVATFSKDSQTRVKSGLGPFKGLPGKAS